MNVPRVKNCLFIACALFYTSVYCVTVDELAHFVKEFWRHPSQVGAVAPCSIAVGHELTKYIVKFQQEHPYEPLRILEVGAGTGPVTEVIASLLRPGLDTLDAVEISSEFCKELHKKFDGSEHRNVSIRCISILDWKPAYNYDFIVSTLPFNSFPYDLMDGILNHLKTIIKPSGVFSYVAYAGVARVKKPFLRGNNKREHIAKMEVLKKMRLQFEIDEKLIIANIPPIHIYHLRFH